MTGNSGGERPAPQASRLMTGMAAVAGQLSDRLPLLEVGMRALAPEKKGPKGPTLLTGDVIARIVDLRGSGMSLRAVGAAAGVSEFSVRRALALAVEEAVREAEASDAIEPATPAREPADAAEPAVQPELPVLPEPAARSGERAAAGSVNSPSETPERISFRPDRECGRPGCRPPRRR